MKVESQLSRFLPLFLCCTLLSGCWDRIDIDRRIFISTIAIDVGKDIAKEDELKKIKPTDPFQGSIAEKLSITYGFPDVSDLSPGKGGRPKGQYISVDASSMQDGILQASSKSSRSVHLEQTKLLMISSDILSYPDTFKEIIDYFQRNPRLNRMLQVVITDGKAQTYITYKPPMENSSEAYLTGLLDNSTVNSTILPISLNELLQSLNQSNNAILPRLIIEPDKKDLKLNGVGIIKNYSLKGFLNYEETSVLEMLRGKLKGGSKIIYKDAHPVDYIIEGMERKITSSSQNGKLKFNVNIKLEGKILNYYFGDKLYSEQQLVSLENDFSKSISQECERVINLTQEQYGVDPIGFREYLQNYDPKAWNKVKNNWSDAYKGANVTTNVQVSIRRIGAVQ